MAFPPPIGAWLDNASFALLLHATGTRVKGKDPIAGRPLRHPAAADAATLRREPLELSRRRNGNIHSSAYTRTMRYMHVATVHAVGVFMDARTQRSQLLHF